MTGSNKTDLNEKQIEKGGGWTRGEMTIALASMVISAIGLLASAASSFFTWQQVRMLSQERLTPYRSILYESKLNSFKELTAQWGNWSVTTYPDLSSIAYMVSTVDGKGMKRVTMGGDDTRDYGQLGKDAKQANLDFSISLISNGVVWPRPIQDRLTRAALKIGPLSSCVEHAGQIAEKEPRVKGVTWDMVTRRMSLAQCRQLKMDERLKSAQLEIQGAYDAMVADLRASQLQSIDPSR